MNNPNQGAAAQSPLLSLEQDLKLYKDAMQETAQDILESGLSAYPVFIAHQHEVNLGQVILSHTELNTSWTINASTLEELREKNVVLIEREEYFVNNYKNPKQFMCLFVVTPKGGNFVFYPY